MSELKIADDELVEAVCVVLMKSNERYNKLQKKAESGVDLTDEEAEEMLNTETAYLASLGFKYRD